MIRDVFMNGHQPRTESPEERKRADGSNKYKRKWPWIKCQKWSPPGHPDLARDLYFFPADSKWRGSTWWWGSDGQIVHKTIEMIRKAVKTTINMDEKVRQGSEVLPFDLSMPFCFKKANEKVPVIWTKVCDVLTRAKEEVVVVADGH